MPTPAPPVRPRTRPGRRRPSVRRGALALLAATTVAACGGGPATTEAGGGAATTAPAGAVTVYTGRHYGIEKVFEAFTAETGIPVVFQTGKDPELRERIAAEGETTKADVYMTSDAGNLALAADAGLLAPVEAPSIATRVPANLRDAQGRWTALSRRARTIVYNPDEVPPAQLSTYEALADPAWKGRLCLRPSTSPYTQSLVAAMIADLGEAEAERVVRGWVANEPTYIDSDTKILEAIDAGQCDVGLTNTYYVARLLGERPDAKVKVFWPDEGLGGRGVHVNISGAGVTARAPHPEKATRLLEWLAGPGQKAFADANNEYPAATGVEPTPVVAGFGPFTADPIDVARFGELQPAAVDLLDRTGYQ